MDFAVTITCDQCHTRHDVDPPAWVATSGRPFRFRCSACGHSQSVSPDMVGGGEITQPVAPALIDTPPPRGARDVSPDEPTDPQTRAMTADTVVPASRPAPAPAPPPQEQGVFLKQNGQIYMVRDWPTLLRWIGEERVHPDDLVSEGGIKWDAIGSRPDLAPLFGGGSPGTAPVAATPTAAFADSGEPSWTDDDTEGVPTGLPPLPTEDRTLRLSPLPPALIDEDTPIGEVAPPRPAPRVDEDEEDTDDSEVGPAPELAPPLVVSPRWSVPAEDTPDSPATQTPVWPERLKTIDEVTEPQTQAPPPPIAAPAPSPPVITQELVDPFDVAWETAHLRRPWLPWAAGAAALVAIVSGGLVLRAGPPTEVAALEPAPIHAPSPTPTPTPSLSPSPSLPPSPSLSPPPRPSPSPLPSPPPSPSPSATPSPPSASALASRGWAIADRSPSEAERLFKRALAVDPMHDDANYGYGYLLLQRNETAKAAPYLCRARTSHQPDVKQDVNGLIANYRITCQ